MSSSTNERLGNRAVHIPTYDTPNELFTRKGILELMRADWPDNHLTPSDVHDYIRSNDLSPVDYIPSDPFPDISEFADDSELNTITNAWVEKRSRTRRGRQIFDMHNKPRFIPSASMPSEGDEPRHYADKMRVINNLGKS